MRKTINGTEHKDCAGKRGCGKFFPATTRYFCDRTTRYTNRDGELTTYKILSTMCIDCEKKAASERNAKRSQKGSRGSVKMSYDYASAVHLTRDWQVVRLGA